MGFSISSPELQAFEAAKSDLGDLIWQAAEEVAHGQMISDLEQAAEQAGLGADARSDIGLYIDEGEAVVGIPSGSSSREAFDLEFGTAVGAPKGWMRATLARHQLDYDEQFSVALSRRIWSA